MWVVEIQTVVIVKVASVFISESPGPVYGPERPQEALNNTRAKCALVIIMEGMKGEEEEEETEATYHKAREQGSPETDVNITNSPPSSSRQPLGVHLAHVAHADESHDEIFHAGGHGDDRGSHCDCWLTS